MYINKRDEIVDKYKKLIIKKQKWILSTFQVDTYIDFDVEKSYKKPKFNVGDTKTFLSKDTTQIGLKTFLQPSMLRTK